MDFNFLFTYYTSFGTIEEFNNQKKIKNGSFPVFELEYNNINQAEAVLYNILNEQNHPDFNIVILPGNAVAENKKWIGLVISIISHIAYKKFQEKKVIYFNGSNKPDYLNEFVKKIKSLGFKNIIYLELGDNTALKNENINFLFLRSLSDEGLLINYIKSSIFSLSNPFQIIVHSSISNNIETIKDKVNNYIRENYKQEELQLLKKIFSLNDSASALQNKLSNKENLLNTKQAYLDFLLNQYPSDGDGPRLNEELKIRKFYHYEYEILPLWYKQLGHLIKVLMGNRTFKSLFNDNVKKYKD